MNVERRAQLERDSRALSLERGRRVGEPGHDEARRYLQERLEGIGVEPFTGESIELPYERGHRFTNLVGVVRGRRPGLDPVLIGAHYDSVIDAPCTDDNATAVAVVLGAAEEIAREPLERDVVIACFDAEEPPWFHGESMGSTRFVEDHCGGTRFAAAIIMDLIGHDVEAGGPAVDSLVPNLADFLFITGCESHPALAAVVDQADAAIDRLTIIPTLNEYVGDMSDHHGFRLAGHPFLFLSCGQGRHYHSVLDTPEWVNFDKVARVHALVMALARGIDRAGVSGPATPADTAAFEARMLGAAFGAAGPLLLAAIGLDQLDGREDLNRLANALRSVLVV